MRKDLRDDTIANQGATCPCCGVVVRGTSLTLVSRRDLRAEPHEEEEETTWQCGHCHRRWREVGVIHFVDGGRYEIVSVEVVP